MEDLISEKPGHQYPDEDLDNKEGAVDDEKEEDEGKDQEEEVEKVLTHEGKLGNNEFEVRNSLHKTYLAYFEQHEELQDKEEEQLQKAAPELSKLMSQNLQTAGLGDWTVVVGGRICSAIALLKPESYGSFKIGAVNVIALRLS